MMAPAVRSALQSIKVPVLIMVVSSELATMKEATVSADAGICRYAEMPDDLREFKGACRVDAPAAAYARGLTGIVTAAVIRIQCTTNGNSAIRKDPKST